MPLLAARGVEATPAIWDDVGVEWGQFDLVVLRSTWDYAERRDEFLAWAASLPRVLNPLPVLEWNTDKKRYLSALEAAGVPIVPTRFADPGQTVELPPAPFVVKPAVSAGGRSSGRFDAGEDAVALDLVRTIHGDGRTAMVQPYLPDGHSEIALVYSGGGYSHSLARSAALPRGGAEAVLYLEETLGPREASEAERAVGDAAMACVPGGPGLLYGRVDLLHDKHGEPLVLELELAEPSLYLAFGAGAAERFADAIAAAV